MISINTKKRYKQIVTELPDIGELRKNSLRVCLSGAALWLAFYETCEEKIEDEEFGEMVKATINSPLIKKAFIAKKPFTKKAQIQKEKNVERDNKASNNEFNWKTEFIKGRDENEYTIIYKKCGICALARKLNHPELYLSHGQKRGRPKEKDLTKDKLKEEINKLLTNEKLYKEISENAKKMSIDNSSTLIYEKIKELIKE